MKALQITDIHNLEVIDLPMPEPAADEVLLHINYVGFCGSDLNTYRGRNALALKPVIPGHEISAVIEQSGENVPADLQAGQLVTVDPYTACGNCPRCRRRRFNACQHNETLGVQRHGAMREWLCVPWQKVIPADGLRAILYDGKGKQLQTLTVTDDLTSFQIGHYATGTYYLELRDGRQVLKTFKVVRK